MRFISGSTRLFVAGTLLVVTGCAADAPVTTVDGSCSDVHGGNVCTWAQMQGDQVIDVGATIPLATIADAPHEMAMAWPPVEQASIELPAAARAGTGLSHLTIFWEPHGHPPGPYLTPHFDFHFYTIDDATRKAIDCADVAKPAELAAGYVLPDVEDPQLGTLVGLCVPGMGMHALPESEMTSTSLFRGTMVVGYYRAAPIFIEPMITRDMLLEKKSFELAIPVVPGMTGPRPTRFRAEYDAAADAYRFTFSGFAIS